MSQKNALPSSIAAPRFATKSPRLAGKGTGARFSDSTSARAWGTTSIPASAMVAVTVVLITALDVTLAFMCESSSDGDLGGDAVRGRMTLRTLSSRASPRARPTSRRMALSIV